ncbi:tyrosine-type recombinase/integrase [Staphylococcus felis]|uniref:tyrosine-type recombinase/integrase n=1 Tax=Staphylococcus felis TaxID=46127 RepID=UPI00237B0FFB|nr:tyrosine-type recombinase/integrase [Staphylococcus felis]
MYYIDDQKNKKYISKSGFKTKAEAKRAAIEIENALNKGMQENKNYLLDEWLEYYLKTWRNDKLSQSTIEIEKFSKKRVMNFYGNIPIKKSHSFLKRALQRAVYDRLIYFNPCDGIELKHKDLSEPQKAQYLPKEQIKPFLEMVKKRDIHQYYMFRTMIETGIRVGEANALQWSDYNNKDKTLSITKSYDQKHDRWNTTKNKEHRTIYITDDLAKELTKLIYL